MFISCLIFLGQNLPQATNDLQISQYCATKIVNLLLAQIKCLPPEIPHGFTNADKEYKENNILQYCCEQGYNPTPGNPRCTKYGWSIKPECEGGTPVFDFLMVLNEYMQILYTVYPKKKIYGCFGDL